MSGIERREQLVARVTEHRAPGGIDVLIPPVGIGDEDAVRRVIDERAKPPLGRAKLILDRTTLGDVQRSDGIPMIDLDRHARDAR